MSNSFLIVDSLIFVGSVVLLALILRAHWKQHRAAEVTRKYHNRLALSLNPAYRQKEEDDRAYELAKQKLELERQKLTVEAYVKMHYVPPETYIINAPVESTYALPSLKRPEAKIEEITPAASSAVQQPMQDYLLSQLEENSLIVSPGIQQSNGEIVKVSIVDVPHLKIIGSTGFGKSCLAGAILDQATQLNSPEVLQLALLDLEHKTSRLFEDLPHVAELQIGKRRISMVATNADEVAQHLGYLKTELDRRAALSEAEIDQTPVLLMYVEEMLSLQYEVVDPKLLSRMFADLTILAVRGRKYGMFLLACMQTDYSSKEMQVSQKMFRFRSAAAIDTTAARAAGFMNTDLVKTNFATGKPGQFVVEYPSFSDIVLAPVYDVKRLVAKKTRVPSDFQPDFSVISTLEKALPEEELKPLGNDAEEPVKIEETALQARFQEVADLREKGWGKVAIVEKVWKVKSGGSAAYKKACAEYEQIIQQLESEA